MFHGHLIGQFFSPATNIRTDSFGGSQENRCRFALMVHEEIRRWVGTDFIVGIRFSIDESTGGGSTFEESPVIARIFEREGLIDFFNVSHGRIETELALANECMPGMAMPSAPWLERAGAFQHKVRLPVFHMAKIADIATARYGIREGLLDIVAMTRAQIADPPRSLTKSGVAKKIESDLVLVHRTAWENTVQPVCIIRRQVANDSGRNPSNGLKDRSTRLLLSEEALPD